MNAKTRITLLTVTLSLAGIGAYATLTKAGAVADGPTMTPSAAATAPADTESSARVNVKALTSNLEFLGDKPTLTGHPLLIEFWATWCPPCRASIAHLNDLNKKHHERGLEIVGISGEDKTVVERFRSRTLMNYSVALDKNQALASEFQVESIPHAWLLDKDGRIIWSGHPMELDEQIIANVLSTRPVNDGK
jgi:thiol-disulfide isomerase/thioredoxin